MNSAETYDAESHWRSDARIEAKPPKLLCNACDRPLPAMSELYLNWTELNSTELFVSIVYWMPLNGIIFESNDKAIADCFAIISIIAIIDIIILFSLFLYSKTMCIIIIRITITFDLYKYDITMTINSVMNNTVFIWIPCFY